MLSSRKEENLLQFTSQKESLPSFGTFGKVFNSLQGLQQRLDDFSLDDLSKAIDKTKTLSLRLAELQQRLRTLIAIRNSTNEAHSAIEKATLENFNLANFDAVSHSSRLPAMTQVNRLIKFSPPSRLAASTIPPDAKIPTHRVIENHNGNFHATQEHRAVVQAAGNAGTDKEWSLAADLTAFDPRDDWTMEFGGSTVPTEESFVEYDPSTPQPTETPATDQIDDFTDLNAIAESTVSPEDRATKSFPSPLQGSEHKPAVPAAEHPTPAATISQSVEGKALVPAGTDFDQRLLDNLIKDYGEFASSPYVPVPIKLKNETATSKNEQHSTNSPLTAEDGRSATRHLPSIQKEGEIDRKLKKLIKDYGEYDIYSRQSPVNLKTGVIGAFLLLGVIFGVFYFFSARNAVDSSRPPVISGAAEKSASAGASVRTNKTPENINIPKSTSGAAAGLP